VAGAALVGFLVSGVPARGDAATALAHPAKITKWWRPPADVRALLSQISPANLQQADSTLVGFGTRHTLSSQTDPVRGIGAAAQWIFSQLQQIAATSGGSMTVQQQAFVQPVSPRIRCRRSSPTSSRRFKGPTPRRPIASTS
jgi:hypothetical protein